MRYRYHFVYYSHVIRPLRWVVLSRSLHVKALEFAACRVSWMREYDWGRNLGLHLCFRVSQVFNQCLACPSTSVAPSFPSFASSSLSASPVLHFKSAGPTSRLRCQQEKGRQQCLCLLRGSQIASPLRAGLWPVGASLRRTTLLESLWWVP